MHIDRRAVVAGTALGAVLGASACKAGTRDAPAVFTIVLLGQAGHGKTTLAQALLRSRGADPSIGFRTAARAYALIDRAGAAAAVPVMIEGLCRADAAILVVSGADGPMSQTREHILLARQMRVEDMAVFISKTDLVDDAELLELIELEVRELLSAYQLKGAEMTVVTGSAKAALAQARPEIGEAAITRLLVAVDALEPSRPGPGPAAGEGGRRFRAETYVLTTEEGGMRGSAPERWPVQLYFDTGLAAEAVMVAEPASTALLPGQNQSVVFELETPLPLAPVTRFAIRGGGRTLGAGVVVGAA